MCIRDRSFDSISLKFDRLVGTMKKWSCIVFGPNRPISGGSWGLRKFKNFRKMKAWLPILLNFNKSMIHYKKCCSENFWHNRFLWRRGGGRRGKLRHKTLLKNVLTAFSADSFIGFWWKLAAGVRQWRMEPYQISRPLNRSEDKSGEKCSQKTILSEFKENLRGKYLSHSA